jgi:hypothetical protein
MALKGMHMLLRCYDERFKLHQRLQSGVLNERTSNVYRDFQDLESKQLLFDLLENAQGDGTNCHEYVKRTIARIIYALFYGFRLRSTDDPRLILASKVKDEFDQLSQVGAYLVDSFPVLNLLPKPLAPWKGEAERHWQDHCTLHTGNLKSGLQSQDWNFYKPEFAILPADRPRSRMPPSDPGISRICSPWDHLTLRSCDTSLVGAFRVRIGEMP